MMRLRFGCLTLAVIAALALACSDDGPDQRLVEYATLLCEPQASAYLDDEDIYYRDIVEETAFSRDRYQAITPPEVFEHFHEQLLAAEQWLVDRFSELDPDEVVDPELSNRISGAQLDMVIEAMSRLDPDLLEPLREGGCMIDDLLPG